MTVQITFSPLNLRRFWSRVDVRGADECWPWTGGKSRDGYGVMGIANKQVLATHVALLISGRPRPPAPHDHALHGDCSDPGCVNFWHLRWGSELENAADRERLKRSHPIKGAAHHASRLTEADVRLIRESPELGYVLAQRFGVSKGAISMIRNRKVWTHI